MTITRDLAEFAAGTKADEIPAEVIDRALALMTDLAGSAIRAAHDAESSPAILAMLERLGLAGEGPCLVFGMSRRFGAGAAALLNGLLAPAILIPVGGLGMYVAQVVPLLAGSAINIVVAAVAGVALAAAGLADHPVGITGPGRR